MFGEELDQKVAKSIMLEMFYCLDEGQTIQLRNKNSLDYKDLRIFYDSSDNDNSFNTYIEVLWTSQDFMKKDYNQVLKTIVNSKATYNLLFAKTDRIALRQDEVVLHDSQIYNPLAQDQTLKFISSPEKA